MGSTRVIKKKSSNALTLHIMHIMHKFTRVVAHGRKVSLSVRSTSQMFGEFPKLAMVS